MFSKSSLQAGFNMEQRGNKGANRGFPMLRQIVNVAARSEQTLFQDFIGATALMVILLGALYVPALL